MHSLLYKKNCLEAILTLLLFWLIDWVKRRSRATQWAIAVDLGFIRRKIQRHSITILISHGGEWCHSELKLNSIFNTLQKHANTSHLYFINQNWFHFREAITFFMSNFTHACCSSSFRRSSYINFNEFGVYLSVMLSIF